MSIVCRITNASSPHDSLHDLARCTHMSTVHLLPLFSFAFTRLASSSTVYRPSPAQSSQTMLVTRLVRLPTQSTVDSISSWNDGCYWFDSIAFFHAQMSSLSHVFHSTVISWHDDVPRACSISSDFYSHNRLCMPGNSRSIRSNDLFFFPLRLSRRRLLVVSQ